MKQLRNLIALAIVSGALLLTGCAKLPKDFSGVNVVVNPSPLEVHNGKIDATISATFPEMYVPKKGVIEITPVLVFKGKELAAPSVTIQGEKVAGNNRQISSKGGNVTTKVSFPYQEDMRICELILKGKLVVGNKKYDLATLKVADGVIATGTLASAMMAAPAIGEDAFQRIIKETKEADILFLIQQSSLRNTELKSNDVVALQQYIKDLKTAPNKELASVAVSAYASPDGGLDLNTKLSEGRGAETEKLVSKTLKGAKVEGAIDAKTTAEDWEGFKELLESSNIQDKELILRVLSLYKDPEVREKEIKNISVAYKELADQILPQLRRSKMAVNVNVIGKTDEEISALAATNPKALSVEELLYAASLAKSQDQKLGIYNEAITNFPNDWRGYNNMGFIYFKGGNLVQAERSFKRAAELNSKAPEVNNNLGIVALAAGEKEKAEAYFGKAAGVGQVLDHNLGLVNLTKGNYEAATKSFGECTANDAVIARIMNNDLSGAANALAKQKSPNATSYYLKAIVASRNGNKTEAIQALTSSISADASMKAKAATDLEFAKLFADPLFKALVK